MKTIKFILKTIAMYLWGLIYPEHQLIDVLKESLDSFGEECGFVMELDLQLMSKSKMEYILNLNIKHNGTTIRRYNTALLNQVSRDKQALIKYVDKYLDLLLADLKDWLVMK